MLWLIWIILMLLVPILAGAVVWYQLAREPGETPQAPGGAVEAAPVQSS